MCSSRITLKLSHRYQFHSFKNTITSGICLYGTVLTAANSHMCLCARARVYVCVCSLSLSLSLNSVMDMCVEVGKGRGLVHECLSEDGYKVCALLKNSEADASDTMNRQKCNELTSPLSNHAVSLKTLNLSSDLFNHPVM